MKKTSFIYMAGAVLAVTGAVLRITHVIDRPVFYLLFSVTLALGIWANELRRREMKNNQR